MQSLSSQMSQQDQQLTKLAGKKKVVYCANNLDFSVFKWQQMRLRMPFKKVENNNLKNP